MRTIIFFVLAFIVMSCTTNVVVNDEYDGYTYDGAKLIKYTSQNQDTVIWYDWSPSELHYVGNGKYTYIGKKCIVSYDNHADVFCEMDDLNEIQWLDANGQYTDTYYDLLSVFSPVWIESEQRYTLYHW